MSDNVPIYCVIQFVCCICHKDRHFLVCLLDQIRPLQLIDPFCKMAVVFKNILDCVVHLQDSRLKHRFPYYIRLMVEISNDTRCPLDQQNQGKIRLQSFDNSLSFFSYFKLCTYSLNYSVNFIFFDPLVYRRGSLVIILVRCPSIRLSVIRL